ncbi:hypothetical protein Q4489_14055 [Thalassotalea sp. 1_MG-2023]|uniref:hypothetical protein n=1 Tax=Thalassotalea sp. 1_MG-2023 TaxID=3062680 RepID=UPI0026E444FB|nr:hypothetical protein [Thalassotalea sp. 1_MG-2023]MDO6428139.1 hypothetical protein [Thalassotalea sp. 1_MG-2023]
MKRLSTLLLIFLFSFNSAQADHIKVPMQELNNIYELQESGKNRSFPALFIYDTQNERYLTQQEVLNYLTIATKIEFTEELLATIRHYAKLVIKPNISIEQITKVTNVIQFDTPYVAFYHNVTNDMWQRADEGDKYIQGQSRLLEILESANNIQVYTFM